MKTKFIICLCAILAVLIQPASAQMARYYNLFNLADGSTNDLTATIPALTTNQIQLLAGAVTNQWGSPSAISITSSNIILNCHEFNSAGFTFQSAGVSSSTNSIFGVYIYGSASKGAVWDATPRWTFTSTNASAATFTLVTNLDLTGLDRIAFSFINNALTDYQTNVIAGVRLKGSKVMARQSPD